MRISTWVKLVLGLGTLVSIGVGTYVVFTRMDDQMIAYLVGGCCVLIVFVVVGGLLVGKDLVQAYIIRRTIAQDDMSDIKQMAFVMRMMGGLRPPNVNVRVPKETPQQQFLLPSVWGEPQSQQQGPDVFDGQYRDTTIDLE